MKKFIKIQVIQQSTFDLLDYEMIVNIDHIITIQEKAERESRFADLFAGLTPEPMLDMQVFRAIRSSSRF